MAKQHCSPDFISLRAPAKLNLFLHITGQRPNGYHDLQTLFCLTDYADELAFERSDGGIELQTPLPGVDQEDNLIVRAARLLQRHTGCDEGANITVHKRLPMGGGLGGGSSNAASTLLALNTLWQTDLSLEQLAGIGATLGADIPVFIGGRSCLAEGVGELLYPVDLDDDCYLVLRPDCEVSTATIFQHPRLTRDNLALRIAAFFQRADLRVKVLSQAVIPDKPERKQQLKLWLQDSTNACEALVRELYSEVDSALEWLSQHTEARLTGTGSCIYGKFADLEQANAILDATPDNLSGFVCKGSNISVAHKDLAHWLDSNNRSRSIG